MSNFISGASEIYLSKDAKAIEEFDELIGGINWESSASRLEGYSEAIKSNNQAVQDWGKSMRSSADEANILGDAFTEFLAGDWEKLSENADEFKNSMVKVLNYIEQSEMWETLEEAANLAAEIEDIIKLFTKV